jgi:hypothetical protein
MKFSFLVISMALLHPFAAISSFADEDQSKTFVFEQAFEVSSLVPPVEANDFSDPVFSNDARRKKAFAANHSGNRFDANYFARTFQGGQDIPAIKPLTVDTCGADGRYPYSESRPDMAYQMDNIDLPQSPTNLNMKKYSHFTDFVAENNVCSANFLKTTSSFLGSQSFKSYLKPRSNNTIQDSLSPPILIVLTARYSPTCPKVKPLMIISINDGQNSFVAADSFVCTAKEVDSDCKLTGQGKKEFLSHLSTYASAQGFKFPQVSGATSKSPTSSDVSNTNGTPSTSAAKAQ